MKDVLEEKILINGIETNYKILGSGQPLLILHGWNGSSNSWEKVMEFLAPRFQVIIPDFPGFGKSQFPSRVWELNDFVFWFKNFTERLNLKEFFLLGHSFGGRVAIKFSIFYPEKVKKLLLVSSAGIKSEPDLKTRIIFTFAFIGNAIFSPKPFSRLKNFARNFFYKILKNKDYVKAKGVMRETMKKIVNEDLLPVLSQIKQETILIWGKKDGLVPLKYGQIFNEKIKNSKLIILEGIRHSPHLESSEKLSEIIIQFLEKK